jgi:hypothetical protein
MKKFGELKKPGEEALSMADFPNFSGGLRRREYDAAETRPPSRHRVSSKGLQPHMAFQQHYRTLHFAISRAGLVRKRTCANKEIKQDDDPEQVILL